VLVEQSMYSTVLVEDLTRDERTDGRKRVKNADSRRRRESSIGSAGMDSSTPV
jgi:hypothetical protein